MTRLIRSHLSGESPYLATDAVEHDLGVFFAVNINEAASRQTFLGIPDIQTLQTADSATLHIIINTCQGLGQSAVRRILNN